MKPRPLPIDSKAYSERAYREKERWHRSQARMSFKRKLEVLDWLREAGASLPKLVNEQDEGRGGPRLRPLLEGEEVLPHHVSGESRLAPAFRPGYGL